MHKKVINYSDRFFVSKNSCYLDPKRRAMAKLAYNVNETPKHTSRKKLKNWLLKCWNHLFVSASE